MKPHKNLRSSPSKFETPRLVSLGILAFGSLVDHPDVELEEVTIARKLSVPTPFCVEFARSSATRGSAPTLVPVARGGNQVVGQILVLNTSEQDAKDRLWRRETNRVGQGGHYVHSDNPGPNTLIIDRYDNIRGEPIVLSARFQANISPLTPEHLAKLAIQSARVERTGPDGHNLSDASKAKRNPNAVICRL
jgi:hypothetical protein